MEIDFLGSIIEKFAGFTGLGEGWVLITFLALYVYKRYVESREDKHKQRTETLTKLIEYLAAGANDNFMTEMLFQNHFSRNVSWYEIKFFRTSKSPSAYLYRFINARPYLAVSDDGLTLKYKKGKAPVIAKWGNLFMYFFFGIIGAMLVLSAHKVFERNGPGVIAPWSLVIMCMLGLAAIGIRDYMSADDAIKLIEDVNSDKCNDN